MDRFQDTVHILKDYYSGMQARIPSEVGPPAEFLRLPLIEMEVGGDTSATLSAGTLAARYGFCQLFVPQGKKCLFPINPLPVCKLLSPRQLTATN